MKLGKAISRRVKALREASGLSQQEVANRADLSLSLVAKLEQGKKGDPRASTLLALAGALSVTPGHLLDDLFPPEPAESPAVHEPADLNGHADAPHEEGGVAVKPPKAKKKVKAKKAKAKPKVKAKKK